MQRNHWMQSQDDRTISRSYNKKKKKKKRSWISCSSITQRVVDDSYYISWMLFPPCYLLSTIPFFSFLFFFFWLLFLEYDRNDILGWYLSCALRKILITLNSKKERSGAWTLTFILIGVSYLFTKLLIFLIISLNYLLYSLCCLT